MTKSGYMRLPLDSCGEPIRPGDVMELCSGERVQVYEPHHPGLYEYGYWVITDRYGNEMIREGK